MYVQFEAIEMPVKLHSLRLNLAVATGRADRYNFSEILIAKRALFIVWLMVTDLLRNWRK